MRRIANIPFLRITLAFITGIALYRFFAGAGLAAWIIIFICACLFTLVFLFAKPDQKLRLAWLNGISLQILIMSLGYLLTDVHQLKNHPTWYRHQLTSTAKIQARILTPLKATERTYKTTAAIIKTYPNQTARTCGTAILYFSRKDDRPALTVGDEIIFVNKLQPIRNKGNPGEFDFATHSRNKGIFDQAFLTSVEWEKVDKINRRQSIFIAGSEYIKKVIKQSITDTKARAIALALVTGYRDDIDQEMYSNYAKTGLVHLLAISGLHMGIFYLGTQWMLGFLPLLKRNKKILIIVSLIIMWVYALLTTFPPSVQRASLMFTFLGLGQIISRRIPSLQFLFLSAFLMLLFKPQLLWEVSFQLSYTAVLGILLFYKPLRRNFYTSSIITSKVLDIICLTLSAQVFTFPLAIYYFHQFPTLFIFTNIVAIPIVTFIIYGILLLIIFSFIPSLSILLGTALTKTITLLNTFIKWVSTFSFTIIDGLYINGIQLAALLLAMIAIALWLLAYKKQFAIVVICSICLIIGIAIYRKSNIQQQQYILVYNASTTYLELIHGGVVFTKDHQSKGQTNNFEKYVLAPSHVHFGVLPNDTIPAYWKQQKAYDVIQFKQKRLLRIHKAYGLKTSSPVAVDYLIISDKWIKNLREILTYFQANEIIIDGNIPMWKIDDLTSQLSTLHLPVHYIGTEGAKIIRL